MSPSNFLTRAPTDGFRAGINWITRESEDSVDFAILVLSKGQSWNEASDMETAFVLLSGASRISWGNRNEHVQRSSLFNELPSTLHVCRDTSVQIDSNSKASEWAIVRTKNLRSFQNQFFGPSEIQSEIRGAGLAQGACTRNVRLIFDSQNRNESSLVIGEVVNFPGKWSSYPPHHHAQPEIYHYRFTLPQGYGHAEVGDSVMKVKQGDTVQIPGGMDHAQVSAAGYGMYYLWIVKHLPNNPYVGFEFAEEHQWLLDKKNQGWEPQI